MHGHVETNGRVGMVMFVLMNMSLLGYDIIGGSTY